MSGRAPNIIKDSSQPENHLFTLLSSGGATVLLKSVPPDFKKLVLLPCAIFYIYYISGVIYLVKCNTMLLSFILDQVWFTLLLFLHCSEILLYTVRLIRNLAFELEQSHRLLNHFQQWLRLPFKHWINLEMTSSSEVQCTWKSLMSLFSWTVILFSVMSPGERNASGISSKTCVYLYAVANIFVYCHSNILFWLNLSIWHNSTKTSCRNRYLLYGINQMWYVLPIIPSTFEKLL